MTEAEARALWCPFARSYQEPIDGHFITANRTDEGMPDAFCLCIATDCMAWRWEKPLAPLPVDERHGFCGLAGKP
jgi:hypothetical protein